MFNAPIYLTAAQVPQQLRHLIQPGHIRIRVQDTITIPADAGTWSGGSRTLYSAVELATGRAVPLVDTMSAPWAPDRQTRTSPMKPGIAVVETGHFCGKPAGTTFILHPDNAAALLPAPVELTPAERTVLEAVVTLKSAYRPDFYRRQGMPASQVVQTLHALEKRGLVDARNAVTVAGRNAYNSVRG